MDIYSCVASLALVLQRSLVGARLSLAIGLRVCRFLVRSRPTSDDVHSVIFQVVACFTQVLIAYPVNAACN